MTVKKQKQKKRREKVLRPAKVRKIKTKKEAKPARHIISESPVRRTKIRLIGVGGGGSSIVSEIASRMKKADFVVANTDARDLRKVVRKVKRFQFGQDLTHGLGTGMNVEIGETAAQNQEEKIKKLFEGQDVCIIVASLGGGTGSGAVPIFAKISKNSSCLTYGIFTLPFEFEGEKKMEIAKESLGKVKSHLNAYSVIPNERIFQIIDKDAPLKNALSAINQKLAENLQGLIEMIYLPGLINIDFADLKTILSGRARLAYLNTIAIEAPNKPARNASRSEAGGEEAVKKVISSPLYPYTAKGAKGVLYNIVGDKALQLSEVSQISKIISESVNKKAKIIFGINQKQKLQNKIKITLLAVGCGLKGALIKPRTKEAHLINRPKRSASYGVGVSPVRDSGDKEEAQKKGISNKVKKPKPKPKPKSKPKEPKPKPKEKPKKSKPLTKHKKPKKSKPLARQIPNKVEKKSLEKPQAIFREDDLGKKIRRTGLQVKEAVEEEEKEILEREKIWETPAIFRRKNHGS